MIKNNIYYQNAPYYIQNIYSLLIRRVHIFIPRFHDVSGKSINCVCACLLILPYHFHPFNDYDCSSLPDFILFDF